MERSSMSRRLVPALVVLLMVVVSACSGSTTGVSQEDYDAVQAQLTDANSQIASLQQQIATSAGQTNQVVEAGTLAVPPEGTAPSGWDTAESIRGGLHLYATYDSSGDDAFNPADHPLVYFTSEGMGYSHRPSETNTLPGVQVIDAATYQVIASALFDLGGTPNFTPHGNCVSPDGNYTYIATGQKDADGNQQNLTLVINAHTLKLDKVLYQESEFDWGMRSQRLHHCGGFIDSEGNERVVLSYGFGATGGPYFIIDPKDDNRVVHAITSDDVAPMGHPFPAVDPTGTYMYISIGSNWLREADGAGGGVAKVDLRDGSVTIIPEVAAHPLGICVSSDGKYVYVNDATNSKVVKIDNETNEIVDKTSAQVAGPYGCAINRDGTKLITIGKGEGAANTGGVIGIVDLKTFRGDRSINQPIEIGGAIMDHGILNPDPNVNELWVSSAGTFETIVVDLDTYEVKARIPSPHGGDTHSGAFVQYGADWTGETMVDMRGPVSPNMWKMLADAAAAAAAG